MACSAPCGTWFAAVTRRRRASSPWCRPARIPVRNVRLKGRARYRNSCREQHGLNQTGGKGTQRRAGVEGGMGVVHAHTAAPRMYSVKTQQAQRQVLPGASARGVRRWCMGVGRGGASVTGNAAAGGRSAGKQCGMGVGSWVGLPVAVVRRWVGGGR